MTNPAEIALASAFAARAQQRTASDVNTGERRATFVRLARDHAAVAHGVARRLVGDASEAEDVVQEAFLRAWRGLGRFRREAELRTWFFRILINVCRDRLRRRAVRETKPEQRARPPADPELRTSRQEMLERVWEAVEALPPRQRECLLLRVRAGLGHREMSELLGLQVGVVKQYLVQARRALHRRFGEEMKEWGLAKR